jgi:hypothetical protein
MDAPATDASTGAPTTSAAVRGAPASLRRTLLVGGVVAIALGLTSLAWRRAGQFPPDTTPEGAYQRIAVAITEGRVRDCFAYLDDDAQHAAYSIRDYRKAASERIAAAYPEPERSRLLAAYAEHAKAPDGADIWTSMADKRGWVGRLRRDLSGVTKVETSGERATIETARGTRYGFRRRANGIWGLTLFTADLLAECERAARDAEVVSKAAADYERGK